MNACPICGHIDPEAFIDAGRVPVQCTELYADQRSARDAPMGELRLVLCLGCSGVSNAAFDPDLVPYDGDYENSQMFSPAFRRYAQDLAKRLVSDHSLFGRPVVEVGCGKGEFLTLLAELGVSPAIGYDPTYGGEVDGSAAELDLRIERTNFDSESVDVAPALVCARHVLEHMADPVSMLEGIRRAVRDDPSCVFYGEVPDADFTFSTSGIWDLIYQHCTYFSAASLDRVARSAGYDPLVIRSEFNGQFLAIEARPEPRADDRASTQRFRDEVEDVVRRRRAFAAVYRSIVDDWAARLRTYEAEGRRVALWGAGAKGVTFLNVVGGAVDIVVDLNDRKHGRHVAGTGHRVVAPEALRDVPPDVVVVMNQAYEAEIRAELTALGIRSRITAV